MLLPRVYIETTIPSFYHEARTDPSAVARRNWTQHWWDFKRDAFEVVTSAAVFDELQTGEYPTKDAALSLVKDIPQLPIVPEILGIVETYIARSVMPVDPAGDALHLALASFHKCDFLLTWNCKHLANAAKFRHIQVVRLSDFRRVGTAHHNMLYLGGRCPPYMWHIACNVKQSK
jgi:predicted nucleic acid-binding protein